MLNLEESFLRKREKRMNRVIGTVTLLVFLTFFGSVTLAQTKTPIAGTGSVEILFDRTHEAPGISNYLEAVLKRAGVKVIRSDASLTSTSVADELLRCEVLLICQETTSVPFTPAEVKLIKDYVNRGGILILIGNVDNWSRNNSSAPPRGYPLFRLASALGVKLADADHRQDVGKGRLVYFHRRALLSYTSLKTETERGPGQATRRLLSAIGEFKPSGSPVRRIIDPEESFTVGPVRVVYPGNISARVKPLEPLLRRILVSLERIYDCKLEAQVTVRCLPFTGSQWVPYCNFKLNVWAPPTRVAYDLAKQLAYCWYFPGGRHINLPQWIYLGWIDAAAARTLKSAGFANWADNTLRIYRRHFLSTDPKMNQLDLTISPSTATRNAYRGKAIHVLGDLQKQTNRNVVARLRKAIRVCHAAGVFEREIDTDETVRLLSLGLGADQYRFFRKMGVTVAPKPLDLAHFKKLEKELDRLLATK